jgi:glycosyltransferase involved in cell wall biosynthesis
MTRIAVVTNVIPIYRYDYYRRLIEKFGSNLTVYCQDRIPGMNLQLVHEKLGHSVRLVKAWSARREKIAWQWLPYRELISGYDIYFLEGNPRILSTIVLATLLRVLGKNVVICGQKHTAGANPLFATIRLHWWATFKFLFLYSELEACQLRTQLPANKIIISMNNGLDQRAIDRAIGEWRQSTLTEWKAKYKLDERQLLLSCARLEPKNRFSQALLALQKLVQIHPHILWCVIGEGAEGDALKQQAKQLGVEKNVLWLGAIYQEYDLAPWFLSAELLLHPAAIGLSLLHAYGYGLPVVTHNNSAAQMPEFAALTASNSALCFAENNIENMTTKVSYALNNPEQLKLVAGEASRVTRTQYNTAVMAKRFCAMIEATGLSVPEELVSAK